MLVNLPPEARQKWTVHLQGKPGLFYDVGCSASTSANADILCGWRLARLISGAALKHLSVSSFRAAFISHYDSGQEAVLLHTPAGGCGINARLYDGWAAIGPTAGHCCWCTPHGQLSKVAPWGRGESLASVFTRNNISNIWFGGHRKAQKLHTHTKKKIICKSWQLSLFFHSQNSHFTRIKKLLCTSSYSLSVLPPCGPSCVLRRM